MKNRLFAGLVTLALALGGGAPTQAADTRQSAAIGARIAGS